MEGPCSKRLIFRKLRRKRGKEGRTVELKLKGTNTGKAVKLVEGREAKKKAFTVPDRQASH